MAFAGPAVPAVPAPVAGVLGSPHPGSRAERQPAVRRAGALPDGAGDQIDRPSGARVGEQGLGRGRQGGVVGVCGGQKVGPGQVHGAQNDHGSALTVFTVFTVFALLTARLRRLG